MTDGGGIASTHHVDDSARESPDRSVTSGPAGCACHVSTRACAASAPPTLRRSRAQRRPVRRDLGRGVPCGMRRAAWASGSRGRGRMRLDNSSSNSSSNAGLARHVGISCPEPQRLGPDTADR